MEPTASIPSRFGRFLADLTHDLGPVGEQPLQLDGDIRAGQDARGTVSSPSAGVTDPGPNLVGDKSVFQDAVRCGARAFARRLMGHAGSPP
jgi:hypothetical protein